MLTSDFYVLSYGHLVFVNTKLNMTKTLFDVKFFPKL